MDPYSIKEQFPILNQKVNGKPLVYLDNAATTHSPTAVLDASRDYYERYNSNIHRGAHLLARLATEAHEQARESIAGHLGANSPDEVIFTSGTTDSINLVAQSLALSNQIGASHNIVISTLEHHSNIVPWQMLCERTGATLRIIPVTDTGELDLSNIDELIDSHTKLVSFNHISNAFGTVNPVQELVSKAKAQDAYVLIDGAQSVAHQAINVEELGCDFFAFSGHKLYAPTGIGVLWGKRAVLEALPPWRGGGEMIKEVTFEKTTYNDLPFKFEAGTPNIEGAIALAKGFDWAAEIGLEHIFAHELDLLNYTTPQLLEIDGLHILGTAKKKSGVISFVLDNVHHYDLGTLIDQMGVATRTGHHCCQPLMARFGITGTTRASFAVYNTREDCDALVQAVKKAVMMLS